MTHRFLGCSAAIIATVLSLGATALRAQAVTWTIGIGRSSTGLVWVSDGGPISSANQSREAFYPSVSVRQRLSGPLSFAADFQLAPKGFDRTTPTMHSLFAEAALLALIELNADDRPTQFFFGGGLTPGIRVWCRRFNTGSGDDEGCGSDGVMEAYSRWAVAGEWRLGLRQRVGSGRLIAQLRYNRSLVDQEQGPQSRFATTKHTTQAWVLGYELAPRTR